MNKRIDPENFYPPVAYYEEDEISLVDMWLVLMKRKKLLLGTFGIFALIGLIAAIVLPKSYSYNTTIEIGSRIVNDIVQPIESPETLLAKINESYVPLIQHRFQKQNPDQSGIFEMNARIPKGSQIIVLDSKGPESDAGIYMTLQEWVVDEVKKDHQRILEVVRKELEISRNEAQSKLEELKDNTKLLASREKRLGEVAELLKQQITDAKKDLASSEANRKRAVNEATNATKAMTLLMLDNEIQQQRKRLATLEERLIYEVAEGQDQVTKLVSDNLRNQQNQQDVIARISAQLANLVETRSLVPPMQSMEPTGLGRKMILMLALILGAMAALFLVFFAEFLQKVKEQSVEVEEVDQDNTDRFDSNESTVTTTSTTASRKISNKVA